jgi:hypothetical protein
MFLVSGGVVKMARKMLKIFEVPHKGFKGRVVKLLASVVNVKVQISRQL